jgi:hypothetical protein
MAEAIFPILFLSTPSEIWKGVVSGITIAVTDLRVFCRRGPDECLKDDAVNQMPISPVAGIPTVELDAQMPLLTSIRVHLMPFPAHI